MGRLSGASILAKLTISATYSSHPVFNLLFVFSYGLCAYFYTYSMIEDPGYVPKLGSRAQQKAVIDELLSLWKFDDQNFCVSCMVRRPLRSKHCKRCGRCVAKHDQYVSGNKSIGQADHPKPLPMDSQLCWGKQPTALPSVHNCAGGRHGLLHSPCNIP